MINSVWDGFSYRQKLQTFPTILFFSLVVKEVRLQYQNVTNV